VSTIVGISGSLRRGSYNSALLRAAAELMPRGSELRIETIDGIPLYNGDVETNEGIPQRVADLKKAVAGAVCDQSRRQEWRADRIRADLLMDANRKSNFAENSYYDERRQQKELLSE